MHRYFIIYKPYLVLSQFTSDNSEHKTLKDVFDVPNNVYAVGRLHKDSEGLLILTSDKALNNRLLNPGYAHEREYWAQVDGAITAEAIEQLQRGVVINVEGKNYHTRSCKVCLFEEQPVLPQRYPSVRFRKNIPAPWIKIILTEGKNRQVRKMTAGVGFPILRLVRHRIEKLNLGSMQPGDIIELSRKTIYSKLFNKPE